MTRKRPSHFKVDVLPPGLELACRAWRRLSLRRQVEITCQVAEEYSEWLLERYRDVIAVSHGFRTAGRGRNRKVVREPCVGFLVRRKRHARNAAGRERSLPKLLLTEVRVGRQHHLVAVPTDVESREVIGPVVTAQNVEITAASTAAGAKTSTGMLTCLATLPGRSRLHGVSCFHVLGMTEHFGGAAPNARVVDGTGDLGEVNSLYSGRLTRGSDANRNFDAALFTVTKAALPRLRDHVTTRCSGVLRDRGDLGVTFREYVVHGMDGRKVRLQFVKAWISFEITYTGIGEVSHPFVIQSEAVDGEGTMPGDSGSPVVSLGGRTFLGMHIAGERKTERGALRRFAYMVPAPRLLQAENYRPSAFSDDDVLKVETTF
jgi:hypothetical protein